MPLWRIYASKGRIIIFDMAQEDKQLLLKDLCARLPYFVIVNVNGVVKILTSIYSDRGLGFDNNSAFYGWGNNTMMPYLRPMSSMTDAERTKIASMAGHFNGLTRAIEICFACFPVVDYCYSRHLDIHGLIEKGLALEAKEGMYETD